TWARTRPEDAATPGTLPPGDERRGDRRATQGSFADDRRAAWCRRQGHRDRRRSRPDRRRRRGRRSLDERLAPWTVRRKRARAQAWAPGACRRQGKSRDGGEELSLLCLYRRLAAHPQSQLPQSAGQAIACKLAVCARKFENELATFDVHRCFWKHPSLPRGQDISAAHGSADHACTIEHASGRELAQPRRQILFAQSRMTEVNGQREIGAARMINRHESTVRDDVHRLLAAIVRMGAPADVAEQAGGVSQPLFVGCLFQSCRRNKTIGPRNKFLTVQWRA